MAAPMLSDGMTEEGKIKAKLEQIYKRCDRDQECLMVREGSQTKTGYFRYHLRYPGHREVNTTLHRAVYILERRQPDLIRNQAAGEVSHRCGEKMCVEKSHLHLEMPVDNTRRIDCHSSRTCGGCSPPCIIRKQ